ncbi:MAG: biotin/lipoyl-containing protein, partial [Alphaproteobacteria bacterium]
LYAEDPERGFLPSVGTLHALSFGGGEGVRIDTGVEPGAEVSAFYDPMIAKVIARGANRDEALDRLGKALSGTVVAGPRTNVAFLTALTKAEGFRQGHFDTGFIDRNLEALGAVPRGPEFEAVRQSALALLASEQKRLTGGSLSPWTEPDSFQLGGVRQATLAMLVDGDRTDVALHHQNGWAAVYDGAESRANRSSDVVIAPAGRGVFAVTGGRQIFAELFDPLAVDLEHLDGGGVIKAPMHGKVIAVFVEAGQPIAKGQRVAVIEAMKMEHTLTAALDGTVAAVSVSVGDQVGEGATVAVLEAPL